MKPTLIRRLSCVLALSILLTTTLLRAAEKEASKTAAPIRVLIVTGGHGFEAEPFFAVFDAIPDVTYTKAEYPAAAELLKPDLTDQYDVVVFYDMWSKPLAPDQQVNFVNLLRKGIGVVALHHTLGAHRDWPEYVKIIGGRYCLKEQEIDGAVQPKSSFSHGEDMHVTIADPKHPITRGLQDFQIHDETYKDYYTARNVQGLLNTAHPKNEPELAGVTQHGKRPVCYLILGSDHLSYENPA